MKPSSRGKRYQITPDKHLSTTELLALKALLLTDASEPALALKLLLETGARVSELLLLKPKDVLLDAEAIALSGIKGSRDRVIPLRAATLQQLKQHLQQHHGTLLFTFKKRWLQHLWSTVYAPQIGTSKTLHSLRHTFAIELFKHCKDVRLVQQALGHANIENTMVYASYVYSTAQLREALQGVS